MSRSASLVMSSKTNISRRISSSVRADRFRAISMIARSIERSETLRISATLSTPPAAVCPD